MPDLPTRKKLEEQVRVTSHMGYSYLTPDLVEYVRGGGKLPVDRVWLGPPRLVSELRELFNA